MTKINKVDLENIFLMEKELKFKNITSVKIKKGTYEIELSSFTEPSKKYNKKTIYEEEKNKENEVKSIAESKINPENIVKSPMVGVAYLSADPATPQYIKVGQHVKQGDILLLIEAMKTFNEIKAPKSGVISKIIVLNSQPVEFGNDLVIFE